MFEPIPHWCVPIVKVYCNKSDLHYWNNPLQCKVKHLTLEQLEHAITQRPRCKDILKRIVALDAAHLLMDDELERLDEYEYRLHDMPFKTKIMDYLYEKLIINYEPHFYMSIFNCNIQSLACYTWYKSKNWIPEHYNLLDQALKYDCVDLLLLCDQLSSIDPKVQDLLIESAIRYRATQSLMWMRENKPHFTRNIFYRLFSFASLDYCLSFTIPEVVDVDFAYLDSEKILWLLDNNKITKQQAIDSEADGNARFAIVARYGGNLPERLDTRLLDVKTLSLAPHLCAQINTRRRFIYDDAFLYIVENGGILHSPVIFNPNYASNDANKLRLLQLCHWDWNIQWEYTYHDMPEDIMTVSYFIQHTRDYEEAMKLACKYELQIEFEYLLITNPPTS